MGQGGGDVDVDQAGRDVVLQRRGALGHLEIKGPSGRDGSNRGRRGAERLDKESPGAAAEAGHSTHLHIDIAHAAATHRAAREGQVASGLDIGQLVSRQVGDQSGAALYADLLAAAAAAHHARERHTAAARQADGAACAQRFALAHGDGALLGLDIGTGRVDIAFENQVGGGGAQLKMPADTPVVRAGAQFYRATVAAIEAGGDLQIGIACGGRAGGADQPHHAWVAAAGQRIDPQALAVGADRGTAEHHVGTLDMGRASHGPQAHNRTGGLHRGIAHR